MSRSFFLLIAWFLCCTTDSLTQKTSKQLLAEGYKRYPIPHCTITYELSGQHQGTETIFFDRYGLRETKLTNTEIKAGSMSVKTNTLTIMDGEITYSVDLDKKTGSKITNTLLTTLTQKLDEKDLAKMGETMMKRMGAKKTGTGDVAGKKCDVWEVSSFGTSTWVWNAITLKSETNMAGMKIRNAASKVDESAIPEEKFALPTDVVFEDKGSVQDAMKKMKQGKKK
ncbi:MAG: hypothetical protein ACKVRP_12025 [Bacteroidota bacterium]